MTSFQLFSYLSILYMCSTREHACECMYIRRLQESLSCHSSSILVFQSPSLARGCLVTENWGPMCLHLLSTEITRTCHYTQFFLMCVLRIKSSTVSCLGSIRTYHPSPKVVFFLTCCVVIFSELKHPFPKERETCETQLED